MSARVHEPRPLAPTEDTATAKRRGRTVYVVESSPGVDPAKGEALLLLWLRERLAG